MGISDLTLGERQELFARLFSKFLVWFYETESHKGWELRFSEGYVGDSDPDRHGPHLHNGGHYFKTCKDVNLFINGAWITASSSPQWQEIGKFWLSLHPLARWGGVFGDADHLAVLLRVDSLEQEHY